MRVFAIIISTILSISPASAQTILPDETTFDHAWIQGLYVAPEEFPRWGWFVDVQETIFFGAVYGYLGQDSTFITMQGKQVSDDPVVYMGEVYFLTNGSQTVTEVGTFEWRVQSYRSEPAAYLSMTSNILNVTGLLVTRFSFSEVDKIDLISGGEWNIITRILGITFGDHYDITDIRVDADDGTTGVGMFDMLDDEKIGAALYHEEGNAYGMLMQFTDTSDAFYVFNASNTDMYGRFWLLDEDETPTGSGYHFRGASETFQDEYRSANGGAELAASSKRQQYGSNTNVALKADLNRIKELEIEGASSPLSPMFPDSVVQSIYKQTRKAFNSAKKSSLQ